MAGESREQLDRLLREAAASTTPEALQDAAADGGHLDQALLDQLGAGSLEPARAAAMRRHILFCDSCGALAAQRAATSAPRTGSHGVAAPPVTIVPEATRRRLRIQLAILGLLLVVAAGILVFRTTDDGEEGELTPVKVFLDVRSIGSQGPGERGVLRLDQPVFLELTDRFGDQPQYVYVLLLDAQGEPHLLEPAQGAASRRSLEGLVRLPAEGGWDLADTTIQVGDELAFVLFISADPIGALEGEIAQVSTLPNIRSELAPIWPLAPETGVDPLLRRLRLYGFGGVIRALRTRVRL